MIFGKSYGEKHKIEQAKLQKLKGRVKVFAWFPVQESCGRWVWMRYVYKDCGVYEFSESLCKGSGSPIYHLTDKDMPELGSIKTAADIAKFVKDSGSTLESAEIKMHIAEIISSLKEAKMEIADGEGMMNVCEVHNIELIEMPDKDDFAISRLLVSKGFKHTGGPLMPKLLGTVKMSFNVRSHSYKFKQTGLTDKVNE